MDLRAHELCKSRVLHDFQAPAFCIPDLFLFIHLSLNDEIAAGVIFPWAKSGLNAFFCSRDFTLVEAPGFCSFFVRELFGFVLKKFAVVADSDWCGKGADGLFVFALYD